MENALEIQQQEYQYDINDANKDAKELHRLNRKATLATAMLDQEIAQLKQDLQLLDDRKQEVLKPLNEEIDRLKSNLMAFHRDQLERDVKEKTIKLPYATLKSKTQPQDYAKDEDKLLDWVKSNATDYLKVVDPTVSWGELKKNVVVAGGKALLKDTGEIIEGLEPLEKSVKFDVEVL